MNTYSENIQEDVFFLELVFPRCLVFDGHYDWCQDYI